MPIRILDAGTIGRISAGEVVERPSSVVKELVENSLDAGASSITVEIRGGGVEYLRVTDNGCGIEPSQVRVAFENHATSKLVSAEQLDDIRTLGFRGEALPSIASVARVEMITRAKDIDNGVRFKINGGKDISIEDAGCPQGTTIIVRELFFNTPVRRTFMRKPSYEAGLVNDVVTKLLLGNPNVSMRFISGGTTVFHSFGDGKLRHAVFAIYGRETAEGMLEIDASEGGTRIYGLIGVGEQAKATRAHQLFFINGRSVRCPMLTRALEEVCKSRVTIGMYPMCVLNLVTAPTNVDVNVHPNKLEVRFRDPETMGMVCERLLERAFVGERVLEIPKIASARPNVERAKQLRELGVENVTQERMNFRNLAPEGYTPRMPELPEQAQQPKPAAKPAPQPISAPSPAVIPAKKMPETAREEMESFIPIPSGTSQIPEQACKEPPAPAVPKPAESYGVAQEQLVPESKEVEARSQFRVLGVLFKTYILVETEGTLLLIDQHAAHERLSYERLLSGVREGTASQQLLAPLVFTLTAKEYACVSDNLELLSEAGYTVEPFGSRDVRVTAVPFVMGKAEIKPLFLTMLQSLGRLKNATIEERKSEIMQQACKSSVKGGDALSSSEIAALIDDLLATGAPPTCPHGRPVVKLLTQREIEKMFKRIQ